ncbi:MAG: class F sortase [Dehalococcoidia bacterium]|nr:class F sortase [Dehalococcoidia bacterium]
MRIYHPRWGVPLAAMLLLTACATPEGSPAAPPELPFGAAPAVGLTAAAPPARVTRAEDALDAIRQDEPPAGDQSRPDAEALAEQPPPSWSNEASPAVSSNSRALPPAPASNLAVVPLPEDWRLIIPDIGVDAPMVSVGFDKDGAMGAPEGPVEVGWFRYGVAPGQRGNALLDGHVDWSDRQTGVPRTGVFWRLARLSVGNPVIVRSGGQEFTYVVTEKRRYRWDDPEGVSVLQPTSDSRITLITCGDVFDRSTRNYLMRDVVIAQLQ